ncbi:MAG: ComEC/Rec2 family competence protein [Alphaproteobacteria bacterium]
MNKRANHIFARLALVFSALSWRSLLRDNLAANYQRCFLWLPVMLAVGIFAYFLDYPQLLLVASVMLMASMLVKNHARRLLLGSSLTLLLGYGAAYTRLALLHYHALPHPMSADITARVEDSQQTAHGFTYSLQPITAPVPLGRVTLKTDDDKAPFPINSLIAFHGRLLPPPVPSLPHGFDLRQDYLFKNISAAAFPEGNIKIIETPPVALHGLMPQMRQHMRAKINAVLKGDEAAMSIALITGEQTAISEQAVKEMRVAGLAHLLAISGMNIGLAAGIIFFTLWQLLAFIPRLANYYPIHKIAAVFAIFSAIAYTLFVGAPVSAVRSLIMCCLCFLAIITNRYPFSLRLWASSAILVLLIWPESVMGASFLLSYGAVLALLALTEITSSRRQRLYESRWHHSLQATKNLFLCSMVASAATLPISLYFFQQTGRYGVLANMLAVPLNSLWVMPMVVLDFVLTPMGLEKFALIPLGWGMRATLAIAHFAANLPHASWHIAAFSPQALACMLLGLLWLCLWQQSLRWLGLLLLIGGTLWAIKEPRPFLYVGLHQHHLQAGWKNNEGELALWNSTPNWMNGTDEQMTIKSGIKLGYQPQSWLRHAGVEKPVLAAGIFPHYYELPLPNGQQAILADNIDALAIACRQQAAWVITSVYMDPDILANLCPPSQIITPQRLKNGAITATMEGEQLIWSDSRK